MVIGAGWIFYLTSSAVQEVWRYIGGYSSLGTSDLFVTDFFRNTTRNTP